MLKKLSVPFFVEAVGTILALVALFIAIASNGIPGYAISDFGNAILFAVLGLALSGATIFVTLKFGNEHFITAIARIATIIFFAFAFAVIISDRVLVASTFSWDKGNQAAVNAWNTGLTAVILFVVADIAYIVTAFLNDKKAAEQPAEAPAAD